MECNGHPYGIRCEAIGIFRNPQTGHPECRHLHGADANQWPIRHRLAMEKRRNAIVEILRTESPDIVVLHEIDFDSVKTARINQAEEIGRLVGYPYRVEHRDVDAATLFWFSLHYGIAVLSRFSIVAVRNLSFLASNLLLFIAGNLNSTSTGFPNSRQANRENAMNILFGGGGYTTRPLNNPTPDDFTIASAVIDWILVPADWQILSKNVIRYAASDHYALFLSATQP